PRNRPSRLAIRIRTITVLVAVSTSGAIASTIPSIGPRPSIASSARWPIRTSPMRTAGTGARRSTSRVSALSITGVALPSARRRALGLLGLRFAHPIVQRLRLDVRQRLTDTYRIAFGDEHVIHPPGDQRANLDIASRQRGEHAADRNPRRDLLRGDGHDAHHR